MRDLGNDFSFPLMGIDEAGRGPVIGPLVVGCVLCESPADLNILHSIKVKDSKSLSPKKREKIFKILKSDIETHYVIIQPGKIDTSTFNLNMLEYQSMRTLIDKCKPSEVIIDSVGHPTAVKKYLNAFFQDIKINASYKADQKYPVVSAASIVAKSVREHIIEKLKKTNGDFGSGYPSDQKTRNWLEEMIKSGKDLPCIVRKSWSTIENLKGQPPRDK